MRNPEDAYKSKPDVKMPLFESCEHKNTYELPVTGAKVCLDCPNVEIAHARRTDPETSKQAAASVTNLGRTRDAILKILKAHGPMTDEQIREIYAGRTEFGHDYPFASPSGLRSRRSELVRLGLVVDSGQLGKTASGRQTIIWKVAK